MLYYTIVHTYKVRIENIFTNEANIREMTPVVVKYYENLKQNLNFYFPSLNKVLIGFDNLQLDFYPIFVEFS